MKKLLRILGIIVLAALIGFPMVSCGDDGVVTIVGSVLTITNLGDYKGQYIAAYGTTLDGGLSLIAAANGVDVVAHTGNGVKINTDGTAVLYVWQVDGTDSPILTPYKGSDTLSFTVIISDTASLNFADESSKKGSAPATFREGGIGIAAFVPIDIPDLTSGKLTLTGLSDYNGKYVAAMTEGDSSLFLIAASNVNAIDQTGTGVLISEGKATLNVWQVGGDETNGYTTTPYRGSDTVTFTVVIFDEADKIFDGNEDGEEGMAIAKFVSGIGAGVFYKLGTETPDKNSGKLTLTGFGNEYEGKYVVVIGNDDDNTIQLAGASSADDESQTALGGKIENGRVVLNVWQLDGDEESNHYTTTAYNGSNTVTFQVMIYTEESVGYGDPSEEEGYAKAKFKFGIGVGVFYIETEPPEESTPVETSFVTDIPSALVGTWKGDDDNGTLAFTTGKISTNDLFTNAYSFIVKIKYANTDTTPVTINSNGSITTIVSNIAYVRLYSWKITDSTLTITDAKNNSVVFTGTKQ